MAEDIKENQMILGIPMKVRCLDANENSIVTTPNNLVKVMGCLQRSNLYGNASSSAMYSKIAAFNVIASGEGIEFSLSLFISGGNLYTIPAAITLISINVHRGSVKSAKANLIGNLEVDYVYASGILNVWIKRVQYSHYTNVCVLSERGNEVLSSNEAVESIPDGYIVIG